jgi:hypothetical protein
MARNQFQYPYGLAAKEQPLWMQFYSAEYSLKNFERTRAGVINRAFARISLPMPKEPGYLAAHEFGESNNNPVGPMISRAGIANAGSGGALNILKRAMQPATFYWERMFATSTYRRFSNIAEMSMVSEARKKYFFQYALIPKNKEESIQIENIIGTFRKCSYPTVATGLPERSYPQNLWALEVTSGNQVALGSGLRGGGEANLTANWLGEPLVCVLETVKVQKNDESDPVIRYLPNGASSITLLGLVFSEFETGTFDPSYGGILSKSEISTKYMR